MTQVTPNFKSPHGCKKKTATYADRKHMDAVAKLRCVITGQWPVVLHHCFCDRITRYAGRKAPHFDVIPLHQSVHQGMLDSDCVAIHREKITWVAHHGPDWEYIPAVYAEIYGNGEITHAEIEAYWKDKR